MIKQIKDFLTFSRGERNGIITLLIILFILIIIPYFFRYFIHSEKTDRSKFDSLLALYSEKQKDTISTEIIADKQLFYFNPNKITDKDWEKLGISKYTCKIISNYLKKGGKFKTKEDLKKIYSFPDSLFQELEPYILLEEETTEIKKVSEYNLFTFDPNISSAEDFKSLGLNDKLIQIILNYRTKGGKFKSKEDFRKIYGISEDLYVKLEPYISIAEEPKKVAEATKAYVPKTNPASPVELNTADTSALMKFKGIGIKLAEKIIIYRNKLGGFVDKKQLLEVYGIKSEIYDSFSDLLNVNKQFITKININFASVKELNEHPYLDYNQAKAIVDFRSKKGSYTSVEQLKSNYILSPDAYEKIKDYLSIE